MEKYSEVTTTRGYTKYYRCDSIPSPVQFLENLASKGWEFDKVFMKRDAEMDMQFGIGYYSIEELKQSEKSLAYGPVCLFTLQARMGNHSAEIHFSDDSRIVYMVTTEQDFELE